MKISTERQAEMVRELEKVKPTKRMQELGAQAVGMIWLRERGKQSKAL